MITSSIDLGTNTCLLLIAREAERMGSTSTPQANRFPELSSLRVLRDVSTVVRLGEGVDQNRAFGAQPMERTYACLRRYAQILSECGGKPEDSICVATSQARDASNSHEFFSKIRRELGFHFRVLTGEEEAKYTFLGTLPEEVKASSAAVIDIGGGSTEFISANHSVSIDMGSVRFTERFFNSEPVTDQEFWNCQDQIDQALEPALKWRAQQRGEERAQDEFSLMGVAGTITTLGAWYLKLPSFSPEALEGLRLTRGDIHRMVEELKWRTTEEKRKLPGMDPARADVLLAGGLILWRSMELLDYPSLRVSTRGLRYGILGGGGLKIGSKEIVS